MLVDEAYAVSDADHAAAAVIQFAAGAGLVESCSGISEYLLLLLRILQKVYNPTRDAQAGVDQDAGGGGSSISSEKYHPLFGLSLTKDPIRFEGGAHAVIAIVTATFPSFWMDFVRDPSTQPAPLPPPIPLLSSHLSSLNAPTFPAMISALLVAIKHHAHVRKADISVMWLFVPFG